MPNEQARRIDRTGKRVARLRRGDEGKIDQLDARVNMLDVKVDGVEERVEGHGGVDERIAILEEQVLDHENGLVVRVGNLEERVTTLEHG